MVTPLTRIVPVAAARVAPLMALLLLASPAAAGPPPVTNAVEGFRQLISAAHSGNYATNRSIEVSSSSSWEYGQGRSQTVTWQTRPVRPDLTGDTATFAWSCGLSRGSGEHELELLGERILTFTSGAFREPQEWRQDDVVLRFWPELMDWAGEIHGTMYLTLPRQRLTPGEPIELTVRGVDGGDWFMLHHFQDSYAFAQRPEVTLPSGRSLQAAPPKSLYLPPATISWAAPYKLPAGEAATEDIVLLAELRTEAGELAADTLERGIHTNAGDRSLPITLWASDGVPAGQWQLHLSFRSPGGATVGAWQGPIVIGDVSAFRAAASAAEAALARSGASAEAGSILADISLPSTAYRLKRARQDVAAITDVAEFEQKYAGLLDTVAAVEAAANTIARGQDPCAGQAGYAVKAYRSDWDDQLQPYGLYVPPQYDPSRPWPLIVMLHGAGGNPGTAMRRVFGAGGQIPPDEDHGYLIVTPHTRGNLGYDNYVGEDDVLRVIADIQRSHSVDDDRIYLTGLSMGGSGTWHLGLRYPDRFAALVPVCGGTTWRVHEESPAEDLQVAVRDELSSLAHAENALHLPIAVHHGGADPVVSVGHSRRMVSRLWELDYDVQYIEYPGVGHNSWDLAYGEGRIFTWLSQHQRDPWPRKVVHVTANPARYGRSYWVRIDGLVRPHTLGRVAAEVGDDNRISVQAENACDLSLLLDMPLLDSGQSVSIEANGESCYDGPVPEEGWLVLELRDGHCQPSLDPGPMARPPYGGVREPFLDYHAFVYGTRGAPEETDRYRGIAERLDPPWGQRLIEYPVLADTALTGDLQARADLILIGTPETNAILAELMPDLPLKWEDGQPVLGAIHARDEESLLFVYPNPRQPDRRILVVTSGSPASFGQIERIPWGLPEYVVLGVDGTVRASGTFSRNWELVD